MKVRLMKRYVKDVEDPYYEVDKWIHLLGPIGYWSTQARTMDYMYAIAVYEDYKHDRRGGPERKAEVLAIHYGDHRGEYSP